MLSAKVFADNHMNENAKLVLSMGQLMPQEFVRIYKSKVVGITPKKNAGLRRSISSQVIGNKATIFWRAGYAGPQQAGQMTVATKRVIHIDSGFITLKPGVYYFRRYTTPGTGKNFAQIALKSTKESFIEEFYKAHPELR